MVQCLLTILIVPFRNKPYFLTYLVRSIVPNFNWNWFTGHKTTVGIKSPFSLT